MLSANVVVGSVPVTRTHYSLFIGNGTYCILGKNPSGFFKLLKLLDLFIRIASGPGYSVRAHLKHEYCNKMNEK